MSHGNGARGVFSGSPFANLSPEDRDLELAAELRPPSTWAELTPEQLRRAPKIMREQAARVGKVRADGVGNCLGVANNVRLALIGEGVPAEAVGVRVVEYQGRQGPQQHALVDLNYVKDGKPATLTLDMNSPWPLSPAEERRAYRSLPAGTDPYSRLNKPGA